MKESWLVAGERLRAGSSESDFLVLSTEASCQVFPAAQTGEILRVVQADLQRELALGGVDIGGVGETDLHLQVILGFITQTIVRVETPGPALWVLYRVGGILGLQVY